MSESVSLAGEVDMRTTMSIANSNGSMAANLFGICIVILTFTIGLANARPGLGEDMFFGIVLAIVVASIYCFGMSAFYSGCWQTSLARGARRQAERDSRNTDTTMMVGIILVSLEPAAILFSVGWTSVALLSLLFTLVFLVVVIHERRIHRSFTQASNRPVVLSPTIQ
jgi:hypothetical protein